MSRIAAVLMFGLGAALLTVMPCAALTVEQQVTPDFLKAHSKEFALKAERRDGDLVAFTFVRTLPQPKYLVARLVLTHDGKKIAEVSTPSYGKKGANDFFVSLSRTQLVEAEYEVSESFLAGPSTDPVPIPGTVVYKISLKDFAPAVLSK
jgi:hypothetical protein